MSSLIKFRRGKMPLTQINRRCAISPSLGSPERDYHLICDAINGREYHLCRKAVADLTEMSQFLAENDDKAGAFGIGGCDLGVRVGENEKIYWFHSVRKACSVIKITPYDDGYALKRIIEPDAVLMAIALVNKDKPKCLIPVGSERRPLVKACIEAGFEVKLGDLTFVLGIGGLVEPQTIENVAPWLMPVVGRLPFELLYPTGKKQKERDPDKFRQHFQWADIIAGDFLYIGRYAPDDLEGKVVITNTTTVENRDFLFSAGVKAIVTTTPRFEGRTPGTNALWALLATIIRDHGLEVNEYNLRVSMRNLGIRPQVHLRP